MSKKLKIDKGTVEETCLLPLWGRAYETKKKNPRIVDEEAVKIIQMIDYDFSNIEKTQGMFQHGWVARSIHTDKMILEFMSKYPNATIVNIGCGMDTTFTRIDNGKIMYYELDLPNIIELRSNFDEYNDRHKCIASSFLETNYFSQIEVKEKVLFIIGGVLMYFSEEQVKNFFKRATDYFKECDFYFDCLSPKAIEISRKKVLEDSGMGSALNEGWGLKPIKDIEKWDPRFKVVSQVLMYKGVKKGISLSHKIALAIPDLLGFCYMVHLKSKE